MNTDKLLKMLLEAIDYSFLQTDGSYDKTLTYPVIDKIKYIKEQVKDMEVKEVDLKLENENNNPKITVGTKIHSKTNSDVILSIISNDCHGDEFECSNGSLLSLKQIEKYYDIII